MKNLAFIFILFFSVALVAQKELPTVTLTTLDGAATSIQKMANKDGVTIVSLWATWCVPCIKELDAISDLYQDWIEETGVSLIAVSVDDSRTVKRVKSLINGKGWEYDILLDTNNDLKRALGASSIPLTIVIKNNKIAILLFLITMVSGIEDAPSALFKSLFVSKRISYSHPLPFIRDFTLFTVLLSSTETAIRETPVSSIQSW